MRSFSKFVLVAGVGMVLRSQTCVALRSGLYMSQAGEFGFVLLTLTLVSGIVFSEQLFHQALRLNHKNVFTIVSWVIFGGLLIGRFKYGWRGKKAIRWTLSGFGILLLAYIGSKFVLEIVLGR